MSSTLLLDHVNCSLNRPSFLVWSLRGECIEHVCNRGDTTSFWDRFAVSVR